MELSWQNGDQRATATPKRSLTQAKPAKDFILQTQTALHCIQSLPLPLICTHQLLQLQRRKKLLFCKPGSCPALGKPSVLHFATGSENFIFLCRPGCLIHLSQPCFHLLILNIFHFYVGMRSFNVILHGLKDSIGKDISL